MLSRPQPTTQRPPPPSRNTSASSSTHRSLHRPNHPSKLSNVNLPTFHGSSEDESTLTRAEEEHVSGSEDRFIIDLDDSSTDMDVSLGAEDPRLEQQWANTPSKHTLLSVSLPLPDRPVSLRDQDRHRLDVHHTSNRGQSESSLKARGTQPPLAATALTHGKAADFFPWTGAQAEDVVNEHVIKSGFSDKPSGSSQSESHTARPSLWPNLKNKAGLPLLSALFVQVLEKRQNLGRCTAPSTFKPPPRVTLTDTKREAWLRDLANPEVPLRRLSRTIPHGIRGKTLLDQSIGKDIPIPRAVWLAKCVGANEIRAFRRKGISGSAALGGELKWVREWTVFVEQFLEGTIASCGQEGWKGKMDYAIRLATNFFSESLLDTEHYLSWLLASVETAAAQTLPVWIVLVQIYWKHLVAQHRFGRRLANAILAHLHTLASPSNTSVESSLVTRLQQLIVVLATSSKGCLIALSDWGRVSSVFARMLCAESYKHQAPSLREVVARNNRVFNISASKTVADKTPKLEIISLLDSIQLHFSPKLVAERCMELEADLATTFSIILEWASSRYREGLARVYVAAELARYWKQDLFDIEAAVFRFFSVSVPPPNIDRMLLCRIVAELVRSGHFSFGRYLQWLISMGGPSDSGLRCDKLLIASVPTGGMAQNVQNLRRTILQRSGTDVRAEAGRMDMVIDLIARLLARPHAKPETSLELYLEITSLLKQVNGAAKASISQWLSTYYVHHLWSGAEGSTDTGDTSVLQSFCLTRGILEHCQDYVCLTSVVDCAVSSNDAGLLACVADTINLHAEVFAALRVLGDMSGKLCSRQRVLRSQQPLDRSLLYALSNLLSRLNHEPVFARIVASDITLCEQQGTAAACSPASDSMVTLHAGSLDSDADIDRVLTSGNSMDDQLLARMFTTVVERAMKSRSEHSKDLANASRWLAQLRLFDQSSFDQLVKSLLAKMAGAANVEQLRAVATALVASFCTDIVAVVDACEQRIETLGSGNAITAAHTAVKCLRVIVPFFLEVSAGTNPEQYRFQLAQTLFCRSSRRRILRLMYHGVQPNVDVDNLLQCNDLVHYLRLYIIEDRKAVMEELFTEQVTRAAAAQTQRLLHLLLGADDTLTSASPASRLSQIFGHTSEVSLPFNILAVWHAVANVNSQPSLDMDLRTLQPFYAAIERDVPFMPQYIETLPNYLQAQVHEWAANHVLERIGASSDAIPLERSIAQRYLVTASMTALASRIAGTTHSPHLIERLKGIHQSMEASSGLTESQSPYLYPSVLHLLQLAAIRYQPENAVASSSNDNTQVLSTLCRLLCQRQMQSHPRIMQCVSDLVCLYTSGLSTEQLSAVVYHLPATLQSDPRIVFLLGRHLQQDSWLMLASRIPSTVSPTNQASGNATTQAAGQKQGLPSSLPPRPQPPTSSGSLQRTQQTPAGSVGRSAPEVKYTAFPLRHWEILPDPTPNMGENDGSLSLALFAARKV